MSFNFSTRGRKNLGYLVKDREFISVVNFRLDQEQDEWGRPRVYGDMELKGKNRKPTDYEGPLTIHSNQGYSLNLEITRYLAKGRYAFQVKRANQPTS
ncbi:MAG: hypothetical protein ACLFRB_05110 [Thiohalorhabdus sp.]|uniref:hypothetical protein n=1 Tax=Thiohalorhabdus sp. TaxID=3094134 RepID=UPI00397EDBFD